MTSSCGLWNSRVCKPEGKTKAASELSAGGLPLDHAFAHYTAFVFLSAYFALICATRLMKSSAQNSRAIRVTVGLRPAGRVVRVWSIKKPPAFL